MHFFSQEIYLVRHGQTDYNKQKIVQGRGVDSDLNAEGQAQAKAFVQAYKAEGFEHVFASNLKRTYQTIQGFEAFGHTISQHPELDEISWGIHEGKAPSKEIHQKYLAMRAEWDNGIFDQAIEDGESINDVAARLRSFLETHAHQDRQKVLICSHGRTSSLLLCILLDLPFQEMRQFKHDNTACSKVRWMKGRYRLIYQNRCEHIVLDDKGWS